MSGEAPRAGLALDLGVAVHPQIHGVVGKNPGRERVVRVNLGTIEHVDGVEFGKVVRKSLDAPNEPRVELPRRLLREGEPQNLLRGNVTVCDQEQHSKSHRFGFSRTCPGDHPIHPLWGSFDDRLLLFSRCLEAQHGCDVSCRIGVSHRHTPRQSGASGVGELWSFRQTPLGLWRTGRQPSGRPPN